MHNGTRIDAVAFDVRPTDWHGAAATLHELAGRMVVVEIGGQKGLGQPVSAIGLLEVSQLLHEPDADGDIFEELKIGVGELMIQIYRHQVTHCERTVGYVGVEFKELFVQLTRWVPARSGHG